MRSEKDWIITNFVFRHRGGLYADGVCDLIVKFNRQAVQVLLGPGDVKLTVTGKWHAVRFKGSGKIMVIDSGGRK